MLRRRLIERQRRVVQPGLQRANHPQGGLHKDIVLVRAERLHEGNQHLADNPGGVASGERGAVFRKTLAADKAIPVHFEHQPLGCRQRGSLIHLRAQAAVHQVQTLGGAGRCRDREGFLARQTRIQSAFPLAAHGIPDRPPVTALFLTDLKKTDPVRQKTCPAALRIIAGLQKACHQNACGKCGIHGLPDQVTRVCGTDGSGCRRLFAEDQAIRPLFIDRIIRHQGSLGLFASPEKQCGIGGRSAGCLLRSICGIGEVAQKRGFCIGFCAGRGEPGFPLQCDTVPAEVGVTQR